MLTHWPSVTSRLHFPVGTYVHIVGAAFKWHVSTCPWMSPTMWENAGAMKSPVFDCSRILLYFLFFLFVGATNTKDKRSRPKQKEKKEKINTGWAIRYAAHTCVHTTNQLFFVSLWSCVYTCVWMARQFLLLVFSLRPGHEVISKRALIGVPGQGKDKRRKKRMRPTQIHKWLAISSFLFVRQSLNLWGASRFLCLLPHFLCQAFPLNSSFDLRLATRIWGGDKENGGSLSFFQLMVHYLFIIFYLWWTMRKKERQEATAHSLRIHYWPDHKR